MKTRRFFAMMAMAMMMMTANAATKLHTAPAPKPAHGVVVHQGDRCHGHVHHTNFCLREMQGRKHSKRCQCDCHFPKVVPHRGQQHKPAAPARPATGTGIAIPGRR